MISFLIPEKDLPYNPKDRESVAKYTKLLENKTLSDFVYVPGGFDNNNNNKGLLGQKIENLFFFIKTNNHAGADFPDIPLELKTAGLLSTSSRDRNKNISGKWKAKEALPMSAISYMNIVNEEFLTSKFLEKNQNLLLVFYESEKDKVIYDLKIRITGVWSFSEIPSYDKKIIMDDWELIKSKVMSGEAHNISRGDTEYLEAVPSATSDTYTIQPNVDEDLDEANLVKSYEEGLYTENGIPYRSGFYLKENKYFANLINNSKATPGEVVFGSSMTGIKGYFATVQLSTDSTTRPGGTKELFAVSTEFVVSSR